jgi:predicted ribosome quality control (RQC) complex YloA/Tae2 family protein
MGMERIIRFTVEHLDELGDPAKKYLYVEIMGKYSNIIFCSDDNKIIDSIKHISFHVSSVREVLPGRDYFITAQENKVDPTTISQDDFAALLGNATSLRKFITGNFIGLSSVTANEIACRCHLDADQSTASLTEIEKNSLYKCFKAMMHDIEANRYNPVIIKDRESSKPLEYSAFPLESYRNMETVSYSSISEVLETFYSERNQFTNMHQRSTDLRKVVTTLLERNHKKLDLQKRQYKDTDKMDKYKLYGELLQAYAYSLPTEIPKSVTVNNYYDNTELSIPLDETKSYMDNSNRYFEKYNKCKRTRIALDEYMEETANTISHLDSILTAISLAESENDLNEIRRELNDYGFIKKHIEKKKASSQKSKPLHFVTDDGFHIYVGKNNYQNDYLTFKFATGNDWWFHIKKATGSHVIVKTEGQELPDHVYEDAAALAAYYSSCRDNDKVEIDYLQKKNVKKPNKANPGFVIYYTNYSMSITPGIRNMKQIK